MVGAHSNQYNVFKLSSFGNIQSLKVLEIGISYAFMLELFLCKRGMRHFICHQEGHMARNCL